MYRKLAALCALVLALAMSVMPAAAQDVDVSDLEELGLISAYSRLYVVDPGAATPPVADLLGVMAVGFEFDEADTAADAFEEFTCGFIAGFGGIEATDCDGLNDEGTFSVETGFEVNGDPAIEALGEASLSGSALPITLLAVQSDTYIFVVINLGVAESQSADALAEYLTDAEPVDTEVEFSEDGTSTGGFYDLLPQDGDAEVEGLIPTTDSSFLGEPGGTPAA